MMEPQEFRVCITEYNATIRIDIYFNSGEPVFLQALPNHADELFEQMKEVIRGHCANMAAANKIVMGPPGRCSMPKGLELK